MADLPLALQIGEGRERLFDIGVALGSVSLVQVDMVRPETPKAVLDGPHDPHAGVAALVRTGTHRLMELRRQHDVIASGSFERPADDLFRGRPSTCPRYRRN